MRDSDKAPSVPEPPAPPAFTRRIKVIAPQAVGVGLLALLPLLVLAGVFGTMQTVPHVAAVYLFVLVGLRVLGKRELGQLSPIELVTLLMIPEIVSQALTAGDSSLGNALAGVATLLVLVFVTSLLSHRFKSFEAAITGEPTVLVHGGKLREDAMNNTRITPDEVFSEMHKSGLVTLDQVQWAILETDGTIAIVPTPDARSGSSQRVDTGKHRVN